MATKVVTIGGKPYGFGTTALGWTFKGKAKRDVAYLVQPHPVTGLPSQCTCADFFYRKEECKHMTEVYRQIKFKVKELGRWSMEHPTKARCYWFLLMESETTGKRWIKYQRWEGNQMVSEVCLPVEEGQQRWKWLEQIGYAQIGAMSSGALK